MMLDEDEEVKKGILYNLVYNGKKASEQDSNRNNVVISMTDVATNTIFFMGIKFCPITSLINELRFLS